MLLVGRLTPVFAIHWSFHRNNGSFSNTLSLIVDPLSVEILFCSVFQAQSDLLAHPDRFEFPSFKAHYSSFSVVNAYWLAWMLDGLDDLAKWCIHNSKDLISLNDSNYNLNISLYTERPWMLRICVTVPHIFWLNLSISLLDPFIVNPVHTNNMWWVILDLYSDHFRSFFPRYDLFLCDSIFSIFTFKNPRRSLLDRFRPRPPIHIVLFSGHMLFPESRHLLRRSQILPGHIKWIRLLVGTSAHLHHFLINKLLGGVLSHWLVMHFSGHFSFLYLFLSSEELSWFHSNGLLRFQLSWFRLRGLTRLKLSCWFHSSLGFFGVLRLLWALPISWGLGLWFSTSVGSYLIFGPLYIGSPVIRNWTFLRRLCSSFCSCFLIRFLLLKSKSFIMLFFKFLGEFLVYSCLPIVSLDLCRISALLRSLLLLCFLVGNLVLRFNLLLQRLFLFLKSLLLSLGSFCSCFLLRIWSLHFLLYLLLCCLLLTLSHFGLIIGLPVLLNRIELSHFGALQVISRAILVKYHDFWLLLLGLPEWFAHHQLSFINVLLSGRIRNSVTPPDNNHFVALLVLLDGAEHFVRVIDRLVVPLVDNFVVLIDDELSNDALAGVLLVVCHARTAEFNGRWRFVILFAWCDVSCFFDLGGFFGRIVFGFDLINLAFQFIRSFQIRYRLVFFLVLRFVWLTSHRLLIVVTVKSLFFLWRCCSKASFANPKPLNHVAHIGTLIATILIFCIPWCTSRQWRPGDPLLLHKLPEPFSAPSATLISTLLIKVWNSLKFLCLVWILVVLIHDIVSVHKLLSTFHFKTILLHD